MSPSPIPPSFKPFLWSYDFDRLHSDTDKEAIIINAINYGTLQHWSWLVSNYGKSEVRRVLEQIPMTAIRPRVRTLAALLFSIHQWNYAPRGPHGRS